MSVVKIIVDLLDLEPIEVNLFRGGNRDIGSKNVFGGQVLAQALVASNRTVEPARVCHSLHGYFLLPGDIQAPILYEVERIRDGKSFTTRRVRATQHGRVIFTMAASYQLPEAGVEHQSQMPAGVPRPEDLISEGELRKVVAGNVPEKYRKRFLQDQPIEFRPVEPLNPFAPDKRPPVKDVWFKAAGALPDDQALHQAILAYTSDFGFVTTSLLPHGLSFMMKHVQLASLDHALWFHRPFRVDEWLLYHTDSPAAYGARGFNRGSIYTRDGVLVASCAQEGLIRVHEEG
jgi:acyl-CoA thioesterase-2